jgi:hypothetical protein
MQKELSCYFSKNRKNSKRPIFPQLVGMLLFITKEQIAQDAGVDMSQVAQILHDLLDGRELSGRIDHETGNFILGTGTGPPPQMKGFI